MSVAAEWHVALAEASHNELLKIFAESISGLMREVSEMANFAKPEFRRLAINAHQRILDAVKVRDAETARRRAEKDVAAYAKQLEAALKSSSSKSR